MDMGNKMEMLSERYKIENFEKWKYWAKNMPSLKFDSDWEVTIIPPFAGALARFLVKKNNKCVSVYFDAYSALGFVYDDNDDTIPYFEIYTDDTNRYTLDETEKMMDDIRNYLNK